MGRAWNPKLRRTVYCGSFGTAAEAAAAVARCRAGAPPQLPASPASTASASSQRSRSLNSGVSVAWLLSPDGPMAAFCDCLARKAPVPCRAGCGLAWGLVYHVPERRGRAAAPAATSAASVASSATGGSRARVRVQGSHYKRRVAKRKSKETGAVVAVAVSAAAASPSSCADADCPCHVPTSPLPMQDVEKALEPLDSGVLDVLADDWCEEAAAAGVALDIEPASVPAPASAASAASSPQSRAPPVTPMRTPSPAPQQVTSTGTAATSDLLRLLSQPLR